MNRPLFAFSAMLFFASGLVAQTPATQQPNDSQTSTPTIRVSTEEVTLDMVFHDKKGKPVQDIKPSEVHVFQDGVEQHLSSFNFVANQQNPSAPATTPAATAHPLPGDPMREMRFVTLVFENLDQDGKRFFRQALQDILNVAPEPNLYFSVLVIDQRLNMLQSFTNDRSQLLKSVDKATMWSYTQYVANNADMKAQLRNTLSGGESANQVSSTGDLAGAPMPGGNGVSGPGATGPSASAVMGAVTARMAKVQYDMMSEADSADREQGARGSIDALLALVRAQSQLPGRKVVLYFNPWLFIPETIKEQYAYMISAANRANVTFYTVDPKGLVTWSQGDSGRGQLSGAAGETRGMVMNGGRGDVTTSQVRAQENAENGIQSNSLLWLRDLAQKTGGQAIGETNDVKAPLRAVMDDVRSYYEASFDPHITSYDGKFHRLSVKLDRSNVDVLTRNGYFALPAIKGAAPTLQGFELPLMNAVNAPTPAADLALRAAAEKFDGRGPKIEYMITLEAPLSDFTFAPQADKKTAAVDAPVLAVVRSSTGDLVAKFSKEFTVTVPQTSIDGYKQGNLLQTFHTELAPGTYTLEAAVMDRKDNKLGVKKVPFTVSDPNPKLGISDVVVVRRTEQLKDSPMLDAFYFPGGKVIPTLNNTFKGGPGNVLGFYFSVYPDPSIKDAPKLTMGFYKDGQFLGSADAALPPVQKDGRIPYIAGLPADKFTTGSYEIKLGVTQGSASTEQKVDFQVQ